VVSAVCHGPAGLVNIKLSSGAYLVAGKTIATFTDDEERAVKLEDTVPFMLESRLRERGARVVTAANFQANAQVDGRLVTGQNPASASGVAEAVAGVLKDVSVAAD
jgi:putative intracellular protease/amidase